MSVIKTLSTIRKVAAKYNLEFDEHFKYYTGNSYKNLKDEYLPTYFVWCQRVFKLQYFDGCFNPFLVECTGRFVYDKKTKEPLFKAEDWTKIDATQFFIK